MKNGAISLTPAEWYLMESLWERSPLTGREISKYLEARVSWSRSTSLTMIRRMTEKGYILADDSGAVTLYSPLIHRDDALLAETESILDRVYKGSVSMMLSAVTQKQNLTGEEIAELYEILRRAEEESRNR
ncbi:MAG: BlaI/MecI/CopY family transcriptional regulator [Clostridia bacterium]|nr:BlaI/MecI/CopY family transcriptional regulator [Clostridia bacterium]